MTERRTAKPTELATRPLLNLGAGDQRGLERAFQTLVGRPAADPRAAQALKVLYGLGFGPPSDDPGPELSHPLVPERKLAFKLASPSAAKDPETLALEWAQKYFPEMEFYLPYISLRSARQKRLAQTSRALPPEPEYDEDGFLADYP